MRDVKEKENIIFLLFLVLWVLITVFFGLYENYKLYPRGDRKGIQFNLNFPTPFSVKKIIEVDLSEL